LEAATVAGCVGVVEDGVSRDMVREKKYNRWK
jgi:hypothetical protein